MKVLSIILLFIGVLGCAAKKPVEGESAKKEIEECTSTKDYVTTLEYLRDHKDFALPEDQMRDLASKVSKGCTGAAKRFVTVTNALIKAYLPSRQAVQFGLEFSGKPDHVAEAFLVVFKTCFASDGLDMDVHSSSEVAKSLSSEFDGTHALAISDFKKMVSFCVDELHMTPNKCGSFAAKIARLGEKSKRSVTKAYIEAYEFLISSRGAEMSTDRAAKVAEELVSISTLSVTNFIQAYRYAVSKKGLGMTASDAFTFARQMAEQSVPASKRKAEG